MTTRGRVRGASAVAAAALLVVAVAGCGDDNDSGQPAPRRSGSTPATADGDTLPTKATTPAPETTAPADPAAKRQIETNWERFFDPAVPNDQKAKYLENGERLGPLLAAFNGDKRGGQVAAKVSAVTLTSATGANVTYTLTLNGATALPDAKGFAVQQDKVWKVAVKTLCALVGMSGNSKAPGC